MSKKKKKQQKPTESPLLERTLNGPDMVLDDSGFPVLMPTALGAEKILAIGKKRRSKKIVPTVAEPAEEKPIYTEYDVAATGKVITEATNAVKEGKYGKAMKARSELIDRLTDLFLNMPEEEFPLKNKAIEDIRAVIRIGKSFYEYDEKNREFISNDVYDRVLAKFRGLGQEEPNPYTPKGGLEKSDIRYPRLHNNMDKCYAIGLSDPIPAGVKETDKVESFLIRTYETLGLSSDAEVELELSPKIDGVSVNGTILKDTLLNPQTRGDEDKSIKVIGMHGLEVGDEDVENRPEFGIQYELFITDADREAADKYLNYQYVSNRHCASGLTHRLCTMEDDKLLELVNLFPIEAAELEGTYRERMEYLQKFAVCPKDMIKRKIIKDNLKGLLKKIRKTFEEYTDLRESLSYSIDGMVITVVDDELQEQLGRKGRTNLYQIALKFDPAVAVGEVKGIHLDRGKKGYRTIQVDLRHPVFLDGVRYDHVPVLSAGLFEEMGLREGSEVEVRRVGDVIPSITVLKSGTGRMLTLPDKCEECGDLLEVKNKKLYCGSPVCPGNLAGKITGFLEGLGLDGYSDGFAEFLLMEFGSKSRDVRIRSLADLYKLTDDVLDAHELDRKDIRTFRDKLIYATAKAPDYVVFGSMGWPDIGVARAKMIFREIIGIRSIPYKDFNGVAFTPDIGVWNNLKSLLSLDCDNMQTIAAHMAITRAIGEAHATKLCRFLERLTPEARACLLSEIEILERYAINITKDFDSVLKVGHTGYTPSADVRAVCEKNKFELVDGKSFDILITGDLKSTSGKMERAAKNNLPVYTEETFLKKYA